MHRSSILELFFAFLGLVQKKIYETIEKDKINFKIFNPMTKIFDQFNCSGEFMSKLITFHIPQTYIIKFIEPFIKNMLSLMCDLTVFPQFSKLSKKSDAQKSNLLNDPKFAEIHEIRLLSHRYINTLFYFYDKLNLDVLGLLSNLAVLEREKMDQLMSILIEKKLRSVWFAKQEVVAQTGLIRCITNLLKFLKKINKKQFRTTSQNIRIWMVNLGTNPYKNAIYNFCVERKDPLIFYLRFFKVSTRFLKRK